MKLSKQILPGLIALGLSFLIAWGTVQAMVTAFDLTLELPWLPAALCLIAGVIPLALCKCKRGGVLLLVFSGFLLLHLWRRSDLPHQLWQLVYRISHHYNAAYGCGVFKLVDTPWDAGSAQLPMALLSSLLAGSVSHSILRGRSPGLPLLLSLLALGTCFVVTDTPPDALPLFLLLLGQTLLLLGSYVRCRDGRQGDRLVLLALVPAALFLGLIFFHIPQEGYVNQSQRIQSYLLDRLQDALPQTTVQEPSPIVLQTQRESAAIDLSQVGPREDSTAPVLTLISDTGGTLYLRGQDHDVYEGHSWSASPYRVEPLGSDGPDLGMVTLETAAPREQLYLPYYPAGGLSLIGGRVDNTRLASAYSFRRQGLPEAWQSPAAGEADLSGADPRYLALPEAAREKAALILAPVIQGQETIAQQAGAIAAFLRDHRPYDLQTPQMPQEEEDFALWFLEKAPSGYCVHFATAATVLLRAAGIPARYVSGYMVSLEAGVPVTVTEKQAHAWAEYYEPGLGTWLVLEATPDAGLPGEENLPPTPSTTPATQPATEEPTVTTVPAVTLPQETPGSIPEQTLPAPDPLPSGKPPLPPELLYLAAALLFLPFQARFRIALRHRRQRKAPANRRCLLLWQEAENLARHLKTPPPKELEALAQKAKFSQHTICDQELHQLEIHLREARSLLTKKPWYRRLLYHFVYALI